MPRDYKQQLDDILQAKDKSVIQWRRCCEKEFNFVSLNCKLCDFELTSWHCKVTKRGQIESCPLRCIRKGFLQVLLFQAPGVSVIFGLAVFVSDDRFDHVCGFIGAMGLGDVVEVFDKPMH